MCSSLLLLTSYAYGPGHSSFGSITADILPPGARGDAARDMSREMVQYSTSGPGLSTHFDTLDWVAENGSTASYRLLTAYIMHVGVVNC